MMERWISKGIFSSLTFMLLIGSACACFRHTGFKTFLLNDGETESAGSGNPRLILQEGAIVDIVCKTGSALITGPLSAFGAEWEMRAGSQQPRYTIDSGVFPAENNHEKYHSQVLDGSTFDNPDTAKVMSTLRYTARKEDNNKDLLCTGLDYNSRSFSVDVSDFNNHLHLVIRPAPTPLSFKSTILHKYRGGFVGRIDIPISDYYTSWKIILTFPRKVFDLKGGHFQVANEPCLHEPDCGDDYQKKWVIYQTFANRVQNPGDHLRLTFVARVWKKLDQGVIADVDFYGYNQVFFTDYSSGSSSSDVHVV
ncbi:uncharacterized protein [Amphiura filiformis]|uniref:uncharacterized protein n=1 Tax=Amphiura filiformis TaxID=82378 RepID=UPI003B211E55